jgi:hypothetical protein
MQEVPLKNTGCFVLTSLAAQIGSCRSEHAAFAKVWIIGVYILGMLSIYDPKQHTPA